MDGTTQQTDNRDSYIVWVAEACAAARRLARVNQETVATMAGIARSAVARFESENPAWPRDPDRLVKAYAEAAGIKDSRELWRKGLDLWESYGRDHELPEGERIRPDEFAEVLDEYLARRHSGGGRGARERDGRQA